jgi:antitoxin Phd
MKSWPVQEAKAIFSELLEASHIDGPQMVTTRGVDAVVIVSIGEWKRLTSAARPKSLKELLLSPHPSLDGFRVPPRRKGKVRPSTSPADDRQPNTLP